MGLLHWLDHWLASFERAGVVLLLTGLLGLGLLQVIERNVLASGLFWADELMQHMVLWLGFLGASLATREHRHLSIDVLSHFLPARGSSGWDCWSILQPSCWVRSSSRLPGVWCMPSTRPVPC